MSKKGLARKHRETYESDDGFVEDAPKSKKLKTEPKPRNAHMQKDEEGNEFWELTDKRRVGVSTFNGKLMVGIREFYEKDGRMLPGKKGISMTIEQYSALLELLPAVERVLKARGAEVPRPPYGDKVVEEEVDDDVVEEAVEEEEEEEEEQPVPKKKSKLDKFKFKKNHEATSEEEDG